MVSGMQLAGVTLRDRYTLQRRLGRGGMGGMAFSPDSRTLAVGTQDTVQLWSTRT
ncbi:hypothetical protein [Streptomyces sp. NEAU-YJ-81]|uniref:hypothetical protein n=1 Tax=Streptomyces sp. NEAU-YJ-81 TaxID=2820288 RepID=UPI001ABC0509|nr:hypothetical protein [Streptomyces sp. NEAU-YJ-81]MBO3681397.1 hypothetical protein [Streptomyces sp. NEAU-YJ-81]